MVLRANGRAAATNSGSSSDENESPEPARASARLLIAIIRIEQPEVSRPTSTANRRIDLRLLLSFTSASLSRESVERREGSSQGLEARERSESVPVQKLCRHCLMSD